MDFSEDNVFPAGPCDIDTAIVIPATYSDDEVFFYRFSPRLQFFEAVSIWRSDVYPSRQAMLEYMANKLRVKGIGNVNLLVVPYRDAVIRTMLVARG